MNKKIFLGIVTILSLFTVISASAANPTTVESSTMYFETVGDFTLTYDPDTGTYTGDLPMVEGTGFDVYAKEGAYAWFDEVYGPIVDHDAWPTWDADTADWYAYSLYLYEVDGVQKWMVPNHSGTSAATPWYDTEKYGSEGMARQGVPLSGTVDWGTATKGYAWELDVGEYLPPIDPHTHPKYPHTAAENGGGAGAWDMDWSWGSEVVPLEYPGFSVRVEGNEEDGYSVTLTPAEQTKADCVPGKGKGLQKALPNDNFAKGRRK